MPFIYITETITLRSSSLEPFAFLEVGREVEN